ncbi:hypothetical protein L7F22_013011 [Adiantum nelumboides]|nr:hypothetical protein [Adiantum nelumboides]
MEQDNEESNFSTFARDESGSQSEFPAESSTQRYPESQKAEPTSALKEILTAALVVQADDEECVSSTVERYKCITGSLEKDAQGAILARRLSSAQVVNAIISKVIKYLGKLLSLITLLWRRRLVLRGLPMRSFDSFSSHETADIPSFQRDEKPCVLERRISVVEEKIRSFNVLPPDRRPLLGVDSISCGERLKTVEANVAETRKVLKRLLENQVEIMQRLDTLHVKQGITVQTQGIAIMADKPDDVTEEVSSSQGQQTHEVGESSRPPQTEDEIFRTQLVAAVTMFTQVMQNPRFLALPQPRPLSQPVGTQKQKSEPVKAQP